MELVSHYDFEQCVKRYSGESRIRTLSSLDQFLAMSFGQVTGRDSLRSTVLCLQSHHTQLYHLGFRSIIARKTIADANE